MRHHEKYQTICDYTLTISHDMSVIHDVKHHETPMQKLQALIGRKFTTQKLKNPGKSAFSGVFLCSFFIKYD